MAEPEPQEAITRVWVKNGSRLVLTRSGLLYYWPLLGEPRKAVKRRVTVAEAEDYALWNGFTWLARFHRFDKAVSDLV